MDNIKDDNYYVRKIIADMEFIVNHSKNINNEQFSENELLQDSMLFRLIQISENAVRLSNDFKNEHDEVPWFAIKGLRNRIVHDYGNVDLQIVYDTIKDDIPSVLALLQVL